MNNEMGLTGEENRENLKILLNESFLQKSLCRMFASV